MSQFLAKVEAIRKALGLRPAEELPAPLAISEAMVLMGINANVSWALPEKVEALVEALDLPGFGKSPAATQAPAPPARAEQGAGEVEPPDIAPQLALGQREGEDPTAQNFVDDEDESDVDDVPPAPREAPPGFKIADEPPSAEQLAFSKEKEAPGDALVGKSILYNWPVVGWCVGQVVERNTDGRSFKTIDGEREKVNFLIFYEIDQQTVKTVLRLDDYGSEWVLLASLEATVPIEPGPA